MYLVYLDESGDSGLVNSPTNFFVLSAVLVRDSVWLNTLDLLVKLRRDIKETYGIGTRREIKSHDIRHSSGPLRPLKWNLNQRMSLFRLLMQYQGQNLDITTFAVAIEKQGAKNRGWEPRYAAWTFVLQRINRFCEESNDRAMIFPDKGHGPFIRRRVRHMRRHHQIPGHWGPKTIPFPIHQIVEDPNERESHDSYFIQLSDWDAYAALRSKYVEPKEGVTDDLWDELGETRLLQVNELRGGPPGIVRYP